GTSTRVPVFGFRPTRDCLWRVRKLPKPRISILSSPRRARTMLSKIASTMTSDSFRVISTTRETSSIRSALVILSSLAPSRTTDVTAHSTLSGISCAVYIYSLAGCAPPTFLNCAKWHKDEAIRGKYEYLPKRIELQVAKVVGRFRRSENRLTPVSSLQMVLEARGGRRRTLLVFVEASTLLFVGESLEAESGFPFRLIHLDDFEVEFLSRGEGCRVRFAA